MPGKERPSVAEITETVYDCVLRVDPGLDRSRLHPGAAFEELGLTSIEVMTVIFEIEEAFDILLVDDGLDDFKNLGHGVEIISRVLAARETAPG